MSYKGKYKPTNPQKYKGNPTNIIYRSLWERKFMRYCDLNENVNQWQSEEFWIPYRSPLDNRIHRYFPDFFVKYKDKDGKTRTVVIEIKPKKEVKMPERNPKRRTKSWHIVFKHGLSIKQSGKPQKNIVQIVTMSLES